MAHITADNKISLFPIEVTIEAEGGPYKGEAYKVNVTGMIMEVFVNTFNPQQHLKLKWTFPIDNTTVEEEAIVIKKYTQQRAEKIHYLMEVHYKNLKPHNFATITGFLNRHEAMIKKSEKKQQEKAKEKK